MPDESQSLIDRTEIVDVRAQELFAVCHVTKLPETMDVKIEAKDPEFAVEGKTIYVRFRHEVSFSSEAVEVEALRDQAAEPAEAVALGLVRVRHVVELSFDGAPPDPDEVMQMVRTNTLFMAYPYFRADIQRCSVAVGLPGVVLGYLRRLVGSATGSPESKDPDGLFDQDSP